MSMNLTLKAREYENEHRLLYNTKQARALYNRPSWEAGGNYQAIKEPRPLKH